MIKTPTQLKALVHNIAGSDSGRSQLLFRNYAMERFLERISLSEYRNNFILKGGMLVAAMVGLENRATMDIDTTVRNLPLDPENSLRIIQEIADISLEDNIRFEIRDVSQIMEEAEYNGIRLSLNAFLDKLRIPLKIDISTGDAITPSEVRYQYGLMFEDRKIPLWTYNLETVLAEKVETVLSRGILNTRLRDFYDLHILQATNHKVDHAVLAQALAATCRSRGSTAKLDQYRTIVAQVYSSQSMQERWSNYQSKNSYAAGLEWDTVMKSILTLCDRCLSEPTRSLAPAL